MGIRCSFNPLGCMPKVPKITWTVTNIVKNGNTYVLPTVWNINNETIQNANCVVESAVETTTNSGIYTVTMSYTYSNIFKSIDSSNLSVSFTDSDFSNTNS